MSARTQPKNVVISKHAATGTPCPLNDGGVLQVDADYACWCTTHNGYVNPETVIVGGKQLLPGVRGI